MQRVRTPTLILIGDQDNWTPASWCEKYVEELHALHEVTVQVFPGAQHIFDLEGIDEEEQGRTNRYHPQAAATAIEMTRKFLEERPP